MAINANIGGQIRPHNYKYKESRYLTEDHVRHIYKKIECGNIIDTNSLKQEIFQDRELNRLDGMSGDVNSCTELIVSNAETVLSQMEQWSILINVDNYVQQDRHPKNFYNLNTRSVNKDKYKKEFKYSRRGETNVRIDFGDTLEKLNGKYLDVHEGIQSEILSTTRFDENSDLSMAY